MGIICLIQILRENVELLDRYFNSFISIFSGESHPMQGGEAEFFTVALPESFKYFGNNFTHLHINENGFNSR